MQERKWFSFIKNAGIVLALVLAATQLWDWATAPEDELVAYVDFGPFLQPPQLNSQFERFAELQDREKLAELIELENILADNDDRATREALQETLSRFLWLMRERLPTSLPYEFRLNGIWFVRIANDSPRTLSHVTITLPHTQYLSVKREGADADTRESGEVISLGTMRPSESLSLVSWTDYEVSAYKAEQIKLTHSEGVGEVVVRAPVGPMAQWIDKHWFLALWLLVWLAGMTLLVFAQVRANAKSSKPEPAEDGVERSEQRDGAA